MASSAEKSFLFIHKGVDSQCLSNNRDDASSSSAISSHVQRIRSRNKTDPPHLETASRTSKLVSSDRTRGKLSYRLRSQSRCQCKTNNHADNCRTCHQHPTQPNGQEEDYETNSTSPPPPHSQTAALTYFNQALRRANSTFDRSLLTLDPFHTLPLPLTSSDHSLLSLGLRLYTTSPTLGCSIKWVHEFGAAQLFHTGMCLANLLAATSLYEDFCRGTASPSQRSTAWRLACLNRQASLLNDPERRWGFESLAGVLGALVMGAVTMGGADGGEGLLVVHLRAWARINAVRRRRGYRFQAREERMLVFFQTLALSRLLSAWPEMEARLVVGEGSETAESGFVADAQDECCGEYDFVVDSVTLMNEWMGPSMWEEVTTGSEALEGLVDELVASAAEQNRYAAIQKQWVLAYLALKTYHHRDHLKDLERVWALVSAHSAATSEEEMKIPDLVYVLYKDSEYEDELLWHAVRLVKVLQRVSTELLAKVLRLFADFVTLKNARGKASASLSDIDLLRLSYEIQAGMR